jgi:hypothetical protein
MEPIALQEAVRLLFQQNHYEVDGPLEIAGAEVDLRARSLADPFAPPIYLEVTTERVDNEKYGKDSTKFLLLREREPGATLILVTSEDFTLPVRERARESRIQTLTYAELFARFERFSPYVDQVLFSGTEAQTLDNLEKVYEEPLFEDDLGTETATEFLSDWRLRPRAKNPWIVVVGEYGTGKTALTQILLRRWTRHYQENPGNPVPIRIELTLQLHWKNLANHDWTWESRGSGASERRWRTSLQVKLT